MTFFTVCLCLGSTGPLYAGYMLAGGFSWRLYFYVESAFAAALFILAFFFVEESSYKRNIVVKATSISGTEKHENEAVINYSEEKEEVSSNGIPARKAFIQTLKPWGVYDSEVEFFMTMLRPFTYFLVPAVLWVVTTYGIYIGIGKSTYLQIKGFCL